MPKRERIKAIKAQKKVLEAASVLAFAAIERDADLKFADNARPILLREMTVLTAAGESNPSKIASESVSALRQREQVRGSIEAIAWKTEKHA